MKLTRNKLRQLIQEAIRRVPLFPPVTSSELEQMRAQSRQAAGIRPEIQKKIEDLEMTSDPDNIAMARELARGMGSQRGEITGREEQDFLRAQMIHSLAPVLEPIFGNNLYKFPPRLLDILQKFYESSKTGSEFQVLIYDLNANEFVGVRKEITEDHDSILKKLSVPNPEYIIKFAGPATGEMSITDRVEYSLLERYLFQHFLQLTTTRQTPGHYIFRMAKLFRPDLKVYSAN